MKKGTWEKGQTRVLGKTHIREMKEKVSLPKGGAAGCCAPSLASGDTACVRMAFSGKEVTFRKADKYPGIVQAQVHSRSGSTNKGKGIFLDEL